MSSNSVTIWAGVITQDPQLKHGQSGKAYLSLNVGTTKRWKDRDGNKQEKRCYHEIKLFGKDAEDAAAKAQKLGVVFCQGSLEMETWESQGQKRSKHVVAPDFPIWESLRIFPPEEWKDDRPPSGRSQSRPGKGEDSDYYGETPTDDDIPW